MEHHYPAILAFMRVVQKLVNTLHHARLEHLIVVASTCAKEHARGTLELQRQSSTPREIIRIFPRTDQQFFYTKIQMRMASICHADVLNNLREIHRSLRRA